MRVRADRRARPCLARGLLALAFLMGCTQTDIRRGAPLTAAELGRVAVGQTRAQAIEALGPPFAIESVRGGSRFRYRFRREESEELELSLFQAAFSWDRAEGRTHEVWVRFDHRGRVSEIACPPRRASAWPDPSVASPQSGGEARESGKR